MNAFRSIACTAAACAIAFTSLLSSQSTADEARPSNATSGTKEKAAELRIWTDEEGRTVEGKLIELKDNKAHLQDKQGKVWPVPLDTLSAADQSYLQKVSHLSKDHLATSANQGAHGGDADFKKLTGPFLENYCLDCHDDEMKKGGVSLQELSVVTAGNADMWRRIWEQVALKEMPPRKKKNQPELTERLEISNWITAGLTTAMRDGGGFSDHMRPIKGNHLDHDLLFGTKHEHLEPTSTPARLWRIHPQEHLVRLNDLFSLKRKYDPKRPGVNTHGDHIPSNLDGEVKAYLGLDRRIDGGMVPSIQQILTTADDHGLRNYPFLYSVNSAEALQITKDAETILRFMAYGPSEESGPEAPKYGNEVMRPLTPVYELINDSRLSDERLKAAVEFLFEALTLRPPTAEETAIYLGIARKSIEDLGKEDGAILGLTPIFLDRDALFRPELCKTGKPDEYGRVMLSGDELALAINAAFSYIRPETDHLRTALAKGQLKTREDVKREVTRILNDDSIRKPRVLQFFREYFDYDRAAGICKDENAIRQSGGHPGTYYAAMNSMIANTDRLVELILQEDKQVLKELLTTDRVVYQPYTSGSHAFGILYFTDVRYFGKEGTYYIIPVEGVVIPEPEPGNQARDMEIKIATRKSREEGTLRHVFPNPSQPIYVRQAQAPALNRPPAIDALKAITTVDRDRRLGILTHPAWLASHSDAMDNHAILRGRWIRERLLGDAVPDVPITVDAMLPDEPQSTLRHRMRVTREKECWRCHQKMDPLGLPFEMYNHLGLSRDKEQGQPIDTSGEILLSGDPALDGPVTDAIDMIRKLAASERVEQVFVRHVFRFWMGRNETINDAPILQEAHLAYKDSGGSMKALLVSLLTSDAFLYRKVPTE
ncbi:MAG: DUF1588 domain-containing protein [Planctomycetota bacterium]|nr:DUF1588 domain-containing protein [Planctomycetota bacterium]